MKPLAIVATATPIIFGILWVARVRNEITGLKERLPRQQWPLIITLKKIIRLYQIQEFSLWRQQKLPMNKRRNQNNLQQRITKINQKPPRPERRNKETVTQRNQRNPMLRKQRRMKKLQVKESSTKKKM